jgi:hypothetical protein
MILECGDLSPLFLRGGLTPRSLLEFKVQRLRQVTELQKLEQ